MPAPSSEARRLANQRNAQKSTGPKTPEGKARSRVNAVKHGLTGAGIALPVEDKEEISRRFIAIQEELVPASVLGAYFAHQIALMTVRCQRAARQEAAAITAQIHRAPAQWDEVRAAEADHLMGWIGVEPAAYRRQLVATPEGIDRLINRLKGLISELEKPVVVWDYNHYTALEAFTGRRESDLPISRGMTLSKAIKGDFTGIEASEYEHIESDFLRRNWACDELVSYILAEVAKLEGLRGKIDHAALARDRAESVERALFDAGKEATLARKYEAAASRELHKALRGFAEAEARFALEQTREIPEIPENPTIEAGDQVQIDQVGLIPDAPKRIPNSDLERAVGSFRREAPATENPSYPPPAPTRLRSDHRVEKARLAARKRVR